jgi:AraC-like DNA-binding protein
VTGAVSPEESVRGEAMLAQPVESFLTPEEPLDAVIVQYEQPRALEIYMHQCLEVGVLIDGRQEQHYQDFVIHVAPGDVSLIAGWEPHGARILEKGTRRLSLYFVPEFLGEESFEGIHWLALFANRPEERPRVTDEETRQEVLRVGRQLIHEIEQKKWGWQSAVRLGILQMLLNMSRGWKAPEDRVRESQARMNDLARIVPAISLVQQRASLRVSRQEAAALCRLSVSQFALLFRQAMGMTFGKFVIRNRVSRAAELLVATESPLKRIARDTGFSHSSHLHRSFVEYYRCTPGEYRQHRVAGHPKSS